jgi:hypothetical protein
MFFEESNTSFYRIEGNIVQHGNRNSRSVKPMKYMMNENNLMAYYLDSTFLFYISYSNITSLLWKTQLCGRILNYNVFLQADISQLVSLVFFEGMPGVLHRYPEFRASGSFEPNDLLHVEPLPSEGSEGKHSPRNPTRCKHRLAYSSRLP